MNVRQVTNALELMEFFADRGRPATLAEVSKHFDWPRSSTFNLLQTLSKRGYLYEPRSREGYYPSPAWLPLIQKIDRAAPVPIEYQNLLNSLQERTGETAVLGAISGMNVIFIAAVESTHAVRYTAEVGKIVPIHASATGRALLSLLGENECAAILRRAVFEKYTSTTLMSFEAVANEIAESRRRGFFEGVGEYTQDLGGIAMPLATTNRHLAVLVAGPMSRVQPYKNEIVCAMKKEFARHVPLNSEVSDQLATRKRLGTASQSKPMPAASSCSREIPHSKAR